METQTKMQQAPGDDPDRAAYMQHVRQRKYRGDTCTSLGIVATTLVLVVAWHFAAVRALAFLHASVGEYPYFLFVCKIPLCVAYGLLVIRSFIVMHDCGHGSFFQGFPAARRWNNACGMLFSNICCTPTDWSNAHYLHHNNVGNMDQDDYEWSETIFHTTQQFNEMPRWKRYFLGTLRHPTIFFTGGPVLVWWLKYRVPFNSTNQFGNPTKSPYRVSNKMLNTFHVLTRHAITCYLCGWEFYGLVFFGELCGATMGVMLFHMQHVYTPGYVRRTGWDHTKASIEGSSVLKMPAFLRFFSLGIEYHHIHHLMTKVPGYRLKQCHEEAPAGLWKNVTQLTYADMWRSIQCTLYDEDTDQFLTFAEYLQQQKKN